MVEVMPELIWCIRRRCPGNHVVESSIWLLIATMLAVLNIHKPTDERGVPVEPNVVFDNLIFRRV
jgi:hypothetical protein